MAGVHAVIYIALHTLTILDRYSVRHSHNFSHRLQETKVFSIINVVKAKDIPQTVIKIVGLFGFPIMSFGFSNAAIIFQRFTNEVVFGLNFSYLTSITVLVFSKDETEPKNRF